MSNPSPTSPLSSDHTTVPTTMRAAVARRYGPPEQISVEEIEVPSPGEGEVLLRVAGASTNALDWHLVTAQPAFVRAIAGWRRPRNPVPGNDVSGTVVALGSGVTGRQLGEEVFGACRRGACAEYVVVGAEDVRRVPDGIDTAEAATVGVAAFTALQAVRDQAEIRSGERVLVLGSSSGVGVFTIPLAVDAGAEVTAVTSTPNLELIRSLGAGRVIDRLTTPIDELGDVVGGPFDVILDLAGAVPVKQLLPLLTEKGRFVLVGGPKHGHVRLMWPFLTTMVRSKFGRRDIRTFTATEPPRDRRVLADHLTAGTIRPVIGRQGGLDDVAVAIREHGDRTAAAKTLIRP